MQSRLNNERGDTFMVMMTTLNMLLLAFFIVLNALSVPSKENEKKALGSILGTFGILSAGMTPGENSGDLLTPPSSEISTEKPRLKDLLANLERFTKVHKLGGDVSVQKGQLGVKLLMTSKILFEDGNAILTDEGIEMIKKIALVASEMEGEMNISGYTEAGSYRYGPYPNDWNLSWARAGSVVRIVLDTKLVDPARLSISGYGSTRPLMGGGTPAREHFNDRVAINIEHKEVF